MKKLVLIMMAFMASFNVYAQEANINNNEEVILMSNEEMIKARSNEIIYLTNIIIDMRNISYPCNIFIGIPSNSGRVLGISGPADARIPNWSIDEYNMVTIYLSEDDLVGLAPNNVRYIEIATENFNYRVGVIGIF